MADSPPKTVSAAPPPKADPMPALALGRCMRMTKTTSKQTRNRMTTEAYRRKSDMATSKGSGIDKTTPKLLTMIGTLGDSISEPFTGRGRGRTRGNYLVGIAHFLPKCLATGFV